MKRTPWFPATSIPARPGVYEREFPHCPMYAVWNGRKWRRSAFSPELAARQRKLSEQQFTLRWRGLAKRSGA